MKTSAALVSSILLTQALWSPAIAGSMSFTPSGPASTKGTVDGSASLKSLGPLHASEGVVIIKGNEIAVLSDANDSTKEAELSGALIGAHTSDDASGRTIHGVAVFTKGYSLPAIDNVLANESIKATDGLQRVGRIVDITPNLIRIKTKEGIRIIPTREITEINSPRAYSFSVPASSRGDTKIDPQAIPGRPSQISFSPTYVPDPNDLQSQVRTKTLSGQLSERHVSRKVVTAALWTTGILGCFVIPTAIAVIAPRPHSTHATGGGSSSSSSNGM